MNEFRQPMQLMGSKSEIDKGHPAHKLLGRACLLGHAAEHPHHAAVLCFDLPGHANGSIGLSFRQIPDTAGVIKQHLCLFGIGSGKISHGLQDARRSLGIPYIHLATKGGNIIGIGSRPFRPVLILSHNASKVILDRIFYHILVEKTAF